MKQEKKKILTPIKAIALILLLGIVIYFFINFLGGKVLDSNKNRFNFSAEPNDDSLTLTNALPVSGITDDADSIFIHITGDTIYEEGGEFEVSIVNVMNTLNNKKIPLNYYAKYEPREEGKTIGRQITSNYFTERGQGETVFELIPSGEAKEGTKVLRVYIAPGNTGINATLVISTYLDSSKVAISDENSVANETDKVVITKAEMSALQENSTVKFDINIKSNKGIWISK